MIRLRRWYVPAGLALLFVLALCSPRGPMHSWAAEKSADKPAEPKWLVDRSLTLTPRAEPVPALKYRLFPLSADLREGNAVPIYLRLVHERNDETRREWKEKAAAWNQLPLDQLPVKEARKFLDQHAYMMKQLDLGARRKTAEWNYTLEAGNPIGLLLPDAQQMRTYGGLLTLQARVQMAEGDYVAAAHTFQTGFALGKHTAEGPFLINTLVGVAIASQLMDALLDGIGRAEAPNLYWSLTALPRPLIDLRGGMELEQRVVEMEFPILAELKRERSPADWDTTLKQLRTQLEGFLRSDNLAPFPGTTAADPAARSPELPAARKYLVERLGMPAARVEAMPPAQVLLLHVAAVNDELRDDLNKGAYLPAAQAIPVLQAAHLRLRDTPETEASRLPKLMLPALLRVVIPVNRLERKIAALRVIEAVRLYAAGHDGRLPAQLADITEVPVPKDPTTDQPFEYRRTGTTATLTGPPLNMPFPARQPALETGVRYRLSIRGKE